MKGSIPDAAIRQQVIQIILYLKQFGASGPVPGHSHFSEA
jgi:hypothetical protein